MVDKAKPSAGWYPHPEMAETRRYWDGAKWSDHIAPAEASLGTTKVEISVLTLARGVALGTMMSAAIFAILGWAIYDINKDDPASVPDCSSLSSNPYSTPPPC